MSHMKKKKKSANEYDAYMDSYLNEDTPVSAKPSKKKKKKTGILPVFLIIVLLLYAGYNAAGLILGPTGGQCKELVGEFQKACNDLSATGIAGCLKPGVSNVLNSGLLVAGTVTGTNPNEWLPDIINAIGGNFGSLGEASDMETADIFKLIKLEVRSAGFPGYERKVKCKATFGVFTQYLDIYIRKSHGEPYISKIKLSE